MCNECDCKGHLDNPDCDCACHWEWERDDAEPEVDVDELSDEIYGEEND